MIATIINFFRSLFGLDKDIPHKVKSLDAQIKKSEQKLEKIDNEKLSKDDIIDHFNDKL